MSHRWKYFYPLIAILLLANISFAQPEKISLENQAVLDQISANSLRGHLSFIASDLLEGRATPSRGQDIAAEYIAAQFRRAGLEPVGDDGYFQTAKWVETVGNTEGFALKIFQGKKIFNISPTQVSFPNTVSYSITRNSIYKLKYDDGEALKKLAAIASTKPIVVFTELPDLRSADRSQRFQLMQARNSFLQKLKDSKVALVVTIDRNAKVGSGVGLRRVFDPETNRQTDAVAPALTIHDEKFVKLFDALPNGVSLSKLSLNVAAPVQKEIKLHNVIGIIRGSDPTLKDTYVLVTAHYDHIGIAPNCTSGDCINNGANDDGSGTVSVMELAAALSHRAVKPKRSIVFMTVFGEERGLLGSRYYGRHPILPIEKTVADINLEQVGRTDDNEGSMLNRASMTGFDFSDVGEIFRQAGALTGIEVFKHPRNSDAFFGRSDNQALADQGVPAHTLCVAFEYPDYHGLGDHWEKVDYENMARTNKMVALGLLMIADNPVAPKWNEANAKTAKYVQAWKALHTH